MEYKSLDSERRFKSSSFLKTSGVSGIASSYFFGQVSESVTCTISSVTGDASSIISTTSLCVLSLNSSNDSSISSVSVSNKSIVALNKDTENSSSSFYVGSRTDVSIASEIAGATSTLLSTSASAIDVTSQTQASTSELLVSSSAGMSLTPVSEDAASLVTIGGLLSVIVAPTIEESLCDITSALNCYVNIASSADNSTAVIELEDFYDVVVNCTTGDSLSGVELLSSVSCILAPSFPECYSLVVLVSVSSASVESFSTDSTSSMQIISRQYTAPSIVFNVNKENRISSIANEEREIGVIKYDRVSSVQKQNRKGDVMRVNRYVV